MRCKTFFEREKMKPPKAIRVFAKMVGEKPTKEPIKVFAKMVGENDAVSPSASKKKLKRARRTRRS
jgi:hypothetical protein